MQGMSKKTNSRSTAASQGNQGLPELCRPFPSAWASEARVHSVQFHLRIPGASPLARSFRPRPLVDRPDRPATRRSFSRSNIVEEGGHLDGLGIRPNWPNATNRWSSCPRPLDRHPRQGPGRWLRHMPGRVMSAYVTLARAAASTAMQSKPDLYRAHEASLQADEERAGRRHPELRRVCRL